MQATVAELWVYPIKGCAGSRLQSVLALPTGLQYDRCMMIVDAATGRFITQRSHPMMALIKPRIDGALAHETVHLSGLGQAPVSLALHSNASCKTVTVWRDTLPALDMGDAAAHWLSAALKSDVRLVRFDPTQQRRVKGSENEVHQFADGYPYLILSKASLRALNERLMETGVQPVGADRFRANMIVDDVDAHTEDFSASMQHASGGAFIMQTPCTRCDVPTIDQTTGARHPQHEPSLTLAQYRYDRTLDGVTFGMNATVNRNVRLNEADVLNVTLAF